MPEERRSLTRARLGIEPHLSAMADVAERFGFDVPELEVAVRGMRDLMATGPRRPKDPQAPLPPTPAPLPVP
ncbi:MAG: hypothetical protein JNJ46_16120 [Myxococcales bacterium]|nr:hypothetical protein [Myxococcales bacterium]